MKPEESGRVDCCLTVGPPSEVQNPAGRPRLVGHRRTQRDRLLRMRSGKPTCFVRGGALLDPGTETGRCEAVNIGPTEDSGPHRSTVATGIPSDQAGTCRKEAPSWPGGGCSCGAPDGPRLRLRGGVLRRSKSTHWQQNRCAPKTRGINQAKTCKNNHHVF